MIISRAHSACNPPLEHRKRALRPRRFMALAPIPYHTRGIPRQQVAAGGVAARRFLPMVPRMRRVLPYDGWAVWIT